MELEFMELEFQQFFFLFSVCYNLIVQKSSFKLKLDFSKIELQKKSISLISLKNGTEDCIICMKRAFAHFAH